MSKSCFWPREMPMAKRTKIINLGQDTNLGEVGLNQIAEGKSVRWRSKR